MNPRPLAAWSAAALIMALATTNPVYRAVVALAAINVAVSLRRPETRLRPLVVALALTAAVTILLNLAVSHTGADVFFTLPATVPVLGGPWTLEALVYGAAAALGIVAAVLAAAPLYLALQPHQLVDALPPFLARTGALVGTAMNLIPGLTRSATEIRDAQRMRGWRARRVREWPDLAVPVVLTAMNNSLQLAEAMEARGYGAGARTRFVAARFEPVPAAAALCAVLGAAVFLLLRGLGVAQDWYPFPALSVPPVSLAALACCLTLVSPALIGRRSP